MAALRARRSLVACALLALTACGSETGSTGAPATGSAKEPGYNDGPVADRTLVAFYDRLPSCTIEHRGLSIDFGTSATTGRVVSQLGENVERDGATWSTVVGNDVTSVITLTESRRILLSARVEADQAKNVSLFIDGYPLGSAKLVPGQPKIVTTPLSENPFDPGEHTVLMRFRGKAKDGALGWIDWLRVGSVDEDDATYGAPTIPTITEPNASIGKVPRRAISLRAPATVRCVVEVPRGGRLRSALGVLGSGEVEGEITLRRDGKEPISLVKRALKPGESWEDVDAPLDTFAGEIVQVEFTAHKATKGTRLLFGDPELLVSSRDPEPTPRAQVVVLVVMAGVTRNELPGYANRGAELDNLARFGDTATRFTNHRSSVSIAAGNVATLLTGLPASVHTLTDHGSALPRGVPTVTQRARDAGVQTAMFTAVPTSFAPYGFSRPMTKFVSIAPSDGEDRSALREAGEFLTTTLEREPTARIFLVVHTEGGHPPWAPNAKQLETMPPEKYTGDIQPRKAGQQLAGLRRKKKRVPLPEGDRQRVESLHQLALWEQDVAFGKLLAALDTANVEDKTLLVVTNDISSGIEDYFPEELPFRENALDAPLYVSFPGGIASGRVVTEPTSTEDVATTLAAALGVELRTAWGHDLHRVASGLPIAGDRLRYALFGEQHTVRWGSYLWLGRDGRQGQLCDLSLDWTCTFDRRASMPLLTSALRERHASFEAAVAAERFERETVVLDDTTSASLRVWGALQ